MCTVKRFFKSTIMRVIIMRCHHVTQLPETNIFSKTYTQPYQYTNLVNKANITYSFFKIIWINSFSCNLQLADLNILSSASTSFTTVVDTFTNRHTCETQHNWCRQPELHLPLGVKQPTHPDPSPNIDQL